MKVLVIGGGGREHSLCWKLAQSKDLEKLYCAPGNAGISEQAECLAVSAEDVDGLVRAAKEKKAADKKVAEAEGSEQPQAKKTSLRKRLHI